jgi:membrane-bound lytic murein transglycosylase B
LRPIPLDNKVKLLSFEQQQDKEFWAALDNFYVTATDLYTPMAVYQLSLSILNKKGLFP